MRLWFCWWILTLFVNCSYYAHSRGIHSAEDHTIEVISDHAQGENIAAIGCGAGLTSTDDTNDRQELQHRCCDQTGCGPGCMFYLDGTCDRCCCDSFGCGVGCAFYGDGTCDRCCCNSFTCGRCRAGLSSHQSTENKSDKCLTGVKQIDSMQVDSQSEVQDHDEAGDRTGTIFGEFDSSLTFDHSSSLTVPPLAVANDLVNIDVHVEDDVNQIVAPVTFDAAVQTLIDVPLTFDAAVQPLTVAIGPVSDAVESAVASVNPVSIAGDVANIGAGLANVAIIGTGIAAQIAAPLVAVGAHIAKPFVKVGAKVLKVKVLTHGLIKSALIKLGVKHLLHKRKKLLKKLAKKLKHVAPLLPLAAEPLLPLKAAAAILGSKAPAASVVPGIPVTVLAGPAALPEENFDDVIGNSQFNLQFSHENDIRKEKGGPLTARINIRAKATAEKPAAATSVVPPLIPSVPAMPVPVLDRVTGPPVAEVPEEAFDDVISNSQFNLQFNHENDIRKEKGGPVTARINIRAEATAEKPHSNNVNKIGPGIDLTVQKSSQPGVPEIPIVAMERVTGIDVTVQKSREGQGIGKKLIKKLAKTAKHVAPLVLPLAAAPILPLKAAAAILGSKATATSVIPTLIPSVPVATVPVAGIDVTVQKSRKRRSIGHYQMGSPVNSMYLSEVPEVSAYDRHGQAHHESRNLGSAAVSNLFGNFKPNNPNKEVPNPRNNRMSEPLSSMDKMLATDLASLEIEEEDNTNFDEGQEEFDTGSVEQGEDSEMGNNDRGISLPTVRDTIIEDIQRIRENERMVLDKRVHSYTPKKLDIERPPIRYLEEDLYSSPGIRYVPEISLDTKYGHQNNVPELSIGTKHSHVNAHKIIRASYVPHIPARNNAILNKSKRKEYSNYGPSRRYGRNEVFQTPTLHVSKPKPRHYNYAQKSKYHEVQYRPTVSHPSSSRKWQSPEFEPTNSIGKYESSKYSPHNQVSRVKYASRTFDSR